MSIHIVYQNNAGKLHAHARCGSNRRNMVANTPRLVDGYPAEEDRCGKCMSHATVATPDQITKAWESAFLARRRVSYVDSEIKAYYVQQSKAMVQDLIERQG